MPDPLDRLWRHPSELPLSAARALRGRRDEHRDEHRDARRTGRAGWGAVLVAAAAGAVLTVGALGFSGMLGRSSDGDGGALTPTTGAPSTARVVAAASPGVVGVAARIDGVRRRASGVGVAPGFVVTDAAAVGGADVVTVHQPGAPAVDGRVTARDLDTGIALVAVDMDVVVLPTTPPPALGQAVITLGAPDGDPLVSTGVVSASGGLTRSADGVLRAGMIGTDANLGAGAAGGLLLDAEGRLVGVLTAQHGSPDAAAVPIATVMRVTAALRAHGRLDRGWLGAEAHVSPAGAVTVATVAANGPADRAGLGEGDVVASVDGVTVTDPADLTALVRCHVPGERAVLGVVRDGRRRRIEVVLSRAPAPAATPAPPPTSPPRGP